MMRTLALALVSAAALGLFAAPAQLQEKGGEDETGPYAVVENWPSPWAQRATSGDRSRASSPRRRTGSSSPRAAS